MEGIRQNSPIPLTVHYPGAGERARALAQRVAGVHASFVLSAVGGLNCPAGQKLELLQAVVDTARGGGSGEKGERDNG